MSAVASSGGGLRRRLFKGLEHRGGSMVLRYRRIYILPTRNGLAFAVMLFALWLAAINYNNSLLFLLTFLLGGLATVSILHTFRNLRGLRVTPLPPAPVAAGEPALFPLRLDNPTTLPRTGIGLGYKRELQRFTDVPVDGSGQLELKQATQRRGWLRAERCTLISLFPTGLFRAWVWLDLDMRCLVYPQPEAGAVPPPAGAQGGEGGRGGGAGDDDFNGLRAYQPGDSPRQMAWRVIARGLPPQTKQFVGAGRTRLWLDWDSLSGLDTEARLSRLCRWVLDADREGRAYGLRLPGVEIPPAMGPAHRDRCLQALALA